MQRTVALGFRAKTGRAIAVAVARGTRAPELIWRGEVSLADRRDPATSQPYHEVMELPWEEAVVAVQPLIAKIEIAARDAVGALVTRFAVQLIAVVGSPDKPLAKIGNPHIRAHAAEGMLFRRVLETASSLPVQLFSEKELPKLDAVKVLGRQAGPPWRADERAAATAAWLALTRRIP